MSNFSAYHQAVLADLPVFDLGNTAYHQVGADEPVSFGTSISRFVDAVKPALILGAAYHGYRRNQSVMWALGWVVAARIAPVVTSGIAVAQGFGKRKEGC